MRRALLRSPPRCERASARSIEADRSIAKNVDATGPFAQSGDRMRALLPSRHLAWRPKARVTVEGRHYRSITPALSSGDAALAETLSRCVILSLLQFAAVSSVCSRLQRFHNSAPVAQLDRAMVYETIGREFEPLRARHLSSIKSESFQRLTTMLRLWIWSSVIKVSYSD